MLILLAVAIALQIPTFLVLLPHGLVVAIVGATVAGVIGITGAGMAMAITSGLPVEKSETNSPIQPTPEKQAARDELGAFN
jgi:hypothetical protein